MLSQCLLLQNIQAWYIWIPHLVSIHYMTSKLQRILERQFNHLPTLMALHKIVRAPPSWCRFSISISFPGVMRQAVYIYSYRPCINSGVWRGRIHMHVSGGSLVYVWYHNREYWYPNPCTQGEAPFLRSSRVGLEVEHLWLAWSRCCSSWLCR